MITSVTIESFRGVREGGVDGLAPISILVGPNNTGKSTVLEALAIAGMGGAVADIAGLVLRRGGPPHDALGRAVARGASRASVSLMTIEGNAWTSALSFGGDLRFDMLEEARRTGSRDPMIPCHVAATRGGRSVQMVCYVDPSGRCSDSLREGGGSLLGDAFAFVDIEAVRGAGALEDAYTRIDQAGQLGTVVKALSRSMPGLTDLRILKLGSDFVLHTFFADGPPVPAYVAGDGFKRFLELAAAVVGKDKSVVLLEEPESFQHPRYLQELATLLHLAAKEGTQIILSTHSIELIDLLLNAPEAEGQPYPAVHRLRLHEGKLRATSIPRESALFGRENLLEDLRS